MKALLQVFLTTTFCLSLFANTPQMEGPIGGELIVIDRNDYYQMRMYNSLERDDFILEIKKLTEEKRRSLRLPFHPFIEYKWLSAQARLSRMLKYERQLTFGKTTRYLMIPKSGNLLVRSLYEQNNVRQFSIADHYFKTHFLHTKQSIQRIIDPEFSKNILDSVLRLGVGVGTDVVKTPFVNLFLGLESLIAYNGNAPVIEAMNFLTNDRHTGERKILKDHLAWPAHVLIAISKRENCERHMF